MHLKLTHPILPAIFLLSLQAHAQTTAFNTRVYLDVNNIKAGHLVHGDMWWNPQAGVSDIEYPKGSGKHPSFASALWMSGYDNGNNLHVSAQTYRQNGNDYWPGPLDASGQAISYASSQNWAKIWRINRSDLQTFFTTSPHTVANTPAVILEWPAKGNPNAKGNANVPLTINKKMAPFIDVNNDGVYNALDGDYPDMKGDQMLWWVFNDMGPTHTETNGTPLGVEIQTMAYAYNRGSTIDNVLFYEYYITNYSSGSYSSFRAGLFSDVDLGYAFDDYIGFDSTRRLGFAYNGHSTDGNGEAYSYGPTPPVSGVQLLETPGDISNVYEPAGSFMYYNNDLSGKGNPVLPEHYSNYLSAKFRDSSHLTISCGPNAGQLTNYAFPAGIADPGSECSCADVPGDRRFIITTNGYLLAPGSTAKIAMAFLVTPLDSTHTCPNGSTTDILTLGDSTWNWYHNPPATGIAEVHISRKALNIYPNPSHESIFADVPAGSATTEVYDALGKKYQLPVIQHSNTIELDIRSLAPGVYTILYSSATHRQSGVFVKE